jgi:chromosome partitioning protein
MEGSLDEYDLVSVVQTVGAARHPARLELRDERDELVGCIQLQAGQIVDAQADELLGLEAVRRLLKTPRPRQFYVYRTPPVESPERVGPVTLVLAQVLSQSVPPPPDSPPVLLQGNLAEVNLRDVAVAVSLGRICVGIEVFSPDGRRVGAMYLRGSKVLFASWGRSSGAEALKELLRPRRDGRFVMFRSTDARLGEPIADLTELLRPKLRPESTRPAQPPPLQLDDEEDERDEGAEATLVVPPPTRPKPSGSPYAETGPRTGTRSIARKSFPPPSDVPRPASEVPPALRFRHSERPSAGGADGSILLSELGYGPRPGVPDAGAGADAKIIAVTSPRGGAGRTTVALNLALALARRGQRVLLVDADANGLLPAVRAPQRVYAGVAEVLEGEAELESALLETRASGLTLLPSGELSESGQQHPGWKQLLTSLASRFDIVLVDCPPILYGATPSVLRSASHQLLVVGAEPAAREACEALQARLARELTEGPRLLGLVLNMLDYQVRASVQALERLGESSFASALFDVSIPRSPAFMEASFRGVPVAHSDGGAPMTIAWVFDTLAAALLERLELEQPNLSDRPLLT